MRSLAILTRCPDQRSCARLMCWSMPVCAQHCRTSVFCIMSCHLMLAMRLKQRMWNWSSLRMCRRYGVHASHPYSSVGSTTAQYTLILVTSRTPRSLQRRLVSLPNDPLALPIRAEISSSINAFYDIVLPKYVNLSVTFSGLLSIVMVGAV